MEIVEIVEIIAIIELTKTETIETRGKKVKLRILPPGDD